MRLSSRAGLAILLVTVLLCSFLLFPLFQSVVSRPPQLSAYGDDWNDVSLFRESLEGEGYEVTAILSNPAVINDITVHDQTLVIITGTESPYSALEVEVLASYLEQGGRVLVLGDFDFSNSIADLFTASYTGHRLWDQNYQGNVSMVEVHASLGGGSYTLLLNEPTALRTRQPVTTPLWGSGIELTESVIISSSSNSYIDLDDDGVITPEDDVAGPAGFPVGVWCGLRMDDKELGQAVFIGDSSLAINRMWEREDNAEFMLDLVAELLPDGGTVLFDESRHTQDTFGASLFQAAIGFYFLLSGQTLIIQAIRLNVLVVVILVTLMAALRQPEPLRWRHFFDIHRPRPWRGLGNPSIAQLQQLLLERMRLRHQLYELDDLAPEERLAQAAELVKRYNILLDAGLSALLFRPDSVKEGDIRVLAQKIEAWST